MKWEYAQQTTMAPFQAFPCTIKLGSAQYDGLWGSLWNVVIERRDVVETVAIAEHVFFFYYYYFFISVVHAPFEKSIRRLRTNTILQTTSQLERDILLPFLSSVYFFFIEFQQQISHSDVLYTLYLLCLHRSFLKYPSKEFSFYYADLLK